MTTKWSCRALWLVSGALVFGSALMYYAQAFAAYIISDCKDFGPNARGQCAWPYRGTMAGAWIVGVAACAWFLLLAGAIFRRIGRRARLRQHLNADE